METKQPVKVLLIDDDEDQFILLKQALLKAVPSKYEYILIWESDCEKAFHKLVQNQYDIYLLDYYLGAITGLELLRNALQNGCEKPVILITGNGNQELDERAFETGAYDYFAKQELKPERLERALRRSLAQTRRINTLKTETFQDELTQIYNRKYIKTQLSQLIHLLRSPKTNLSFCLADLDHLKTINDCFGHKAGDEALIRFSQIVLKNLRRDDIFGRFGGDEFALIFPDSSPTEARICLERIQNSLQLEGFFMMKNEINQKEEKITVSGSFGLAEFKPNMTLENLIAKADEALYLAKRLGRNQVVVNSSQVVAF